MVGPLEDEAVTMSDKGLTHVALECCSLKRSLDFYSRFGNFQVVHSRDGVAWISDHTRAFAIVLAEVGEVHPLGPFPHLGFACGDRTEFDRLLQLAREEGRLRSGPEETGGPAGTYAFIDDPDGNTFEISIGQSVEVAVDSANTVAGARRLHVVGVMGSGQDEHVELAEPLGQAIARMGCHLLTGGGGGTMAAVSRAFVMTHPRAGQSIGILRGSSDGTAVPGYPNPFVEIPIRTHLDESGTEGRSPKSRNHLNVLTAEVVVALPGGPGTQSEIELAVGYGRPVLVHQVWASRFPELASWSTVDQCREWIAQRIG